MPDKKTVYFYTVLVALLAVLSVFWILHLESGYLFDSLYARTSLLTAGSVFAKIIQRLSVSIILYVLGISCVVLSVVTGEPHEFLPLARIAFLSSVYVSSLWDYTIVASLCVAPRIRYFWSAAGDVSLIMISAEFLLLIYAVLIRETRLQFIPYVLSLCLIVPVVLLPPYRARYLLPVSVILCEAFLIYAARSFRALTARLNFNLRRKLIFLLCAAWLQIYLLFSVFVFVYKFRTLNSQYYTYLRISPPLTLVYILALLIVYLTYYRENIIYGRAAGQRLELLTKYRTELADVMMSGCSPHIRRLSSVCDHLRSPGLTREERTRWLDSMQQEVTVLQKHFYNISDYQYLRNCLSESSPVKVSLRALVFYSDGLLKGTDAADSLVTDIPVMDPDREIYVSCDPYQIIQVIRDLTEILSQDSRDGKVHLSCAVKQNSAALRFLCFAAEDRFENARDSARLLAQNIRSVPVLGDSADVLVTVRERIRACRGRISASAESSKAGFTFTVDCSLPLWEPSRQIPENSPDRDTSKQLIAMISTDVQLIELIRSYLTDSPYALRTFSTETELLEYVSSDKGIGVIIFGGLFFTAAAEPLCRSIRNRYTMEQLPILLITRMQSLDPVSSVLRYINDVMEEPFSQEEFTRKLLLLLSVQQSARESLRTRLDFLQSQINPHFIFNTLSSIMPLCLKDPEKAYAMLSDFSDYLRGRLYKKDMQHSIPVYQELDLIASYLSIEMVRFPNQIEYHTEEDYNEGRRMLPLLLEPIVENSTQHGRIPGKILTISISVREVGDFLTFEVRDDGRGMTKEQVESLTEADSSTSDSIGIYNVHRRLMLYYSEGLRINSVPGEGTVVSFRIPLNPQEV